MGSTRPPDVVRFAPKTSDMVGSGVGASGRGRMVKRILVFVGAMFLAMGPIGSALAGYAMDIGDVAKVTPRDRTAAFVPITVECPPDEGQTASEGTATVRLTQDQRDGTVSGSGSTSVICDNVLREYSVVVTSDSATFTRGPATASGDVEFPDTMCIEHPDYGTECRQVTMRMVAPDQPIELFYSGR